MTHPAPTPPSDPGRSLAIAARDEVAQLSKMFLSHTGLEKLVTPQYKNEEQVRAPNPRSELGAMLQSLNAVAQMRIDELAQTAELLCAAEAARREPPGAAGPHPLSPPQA